MKTSKSKGFTLIELMVVIAIIALLSSVVLASLKGAREKAMLTKTVGEMKSLQAAIELHRTKYGSYPAAGQMVTDDESWNYAGPSGFETLVVSQLVSDKFISKVPHAPNYPNNCNSDCQTNGYALGYVSASYNGEDPLILTCGKQPIANYAIIFHANNKKINLPRFLAYNGSSYFDIFSSAIETTPPYTYCISM